MSKRSPSTRNTFLLAAVCLLLLASSGLLHAQAGGVEPEEEPSLSRIFAHLRALGADEMEGRGTGARGGERAADYIETTLEELDLEPIAGSYRQAVPMHSSLPLPSSRLTVHSGHGDEHTLELWKHYVLFDTGAQTYLPQPTPLVFVGYGIVAPEYRHNDYQGLDMAGRIAVFLAGEPVSDDDAFFDGARATFYSDPEMKFRTALSRGARGAILLPSPRGTQFTRWQGVRDAFETEDVTLPYGVAGSLNVLLELHQAELLFQDAETSFGEVLELDRLGDLGSFPLATRVQFHGEFRERDFAAPNLLARLPGSDPLLRDDHVIVSAHYDHLGLGRPVDGDAIYNGVIDNASGAAVTLELARILSNSPERPRRSILFLLVTGEEKGLLGSRYYRDHPVVPLHRTVAALNIDGISFLDTTDEFVGIGSKYSTLGELLEQTLASLDLRHSGVPDPLGFREPFYRSDQLAFAQAGIPSILVMEGLAFRNLGPGEGLRRFIEWSVQRYHTPFDDLEQPLDGKAIEQHAEVLLAYVRTVANTPAEPRWLPGAPWIGERLRTLAERR